MLPAYNVILVDITYRFACVIQVLSFILEILSFIVSNDFVFHLDKI